MIVPASSVGSDGQGASVVAVNDLQRGVVVPGYGYDHPTRSSMVDRRVLSLFRPHLHVGQAAMEVPSQPFVQVVCARGRDCGAGPDVREAFREEEVTDRRGELGCVQVASM